MSEPERWRDDGPEEVRALLRAARPTQVMTAEQQARSRERVGRYVAAATMAAALSWVPGAALGAGLGLVAVAAMYGVPAWIAPERAPEVIPTATVAGPAPSTPAPVTSAAPVMSALPSADPPAPPRASSRPSAPPASASAEPVAVDPLAEEVALLDRARAALGASPAEALALTAEHAARFPQGKMGMEREIVAIDALRRLGRADEARARGEVVLSRARGSLYEERVKKLIEGAR